MKTSALESLFNKVVDSFIKKKTPTQVLSFEYCEFFENNYFEEHLQTAASNGTLMQLPRTPLEAVNYYHKEFHLGCCSNPRIP